MKRTITILIITALLIGFAIFELVTVSQFTTKLRADITTLTNQYNSNKDDITILSDDIEIISDYWNESEPALCIIFSHKDLSTTTDSLTRLLGYTRNNDYDNAIVELTLLNNVLDRNEYIMGFNIHNVL